MAKLDNYIGSTELASGLKQKGDKDFPLVEAGAVQVDETGKRLDEKLESIPGQKNANLGEIFNDYKNNKAISEYSHSEGLETFSGSKGFYIGSIKKNDDETWILYLSDTATDLPSDTCDISGINSDDVLSINNNYKYDECCSVISTDTSNCSIIVNTLPFTSLVDGAEWSIVDVTNPEVGVIDLGINAHAEGQGTIALRRASHAEGADTKAIGMYSHTEGRETKAYYAAHAEGRGSEALGEMSHAEGGWTKALGNNSHSEGNTTTARAIYSHAEGYITEANGIASHSEGKKTKSNGHFSHTEGEYTIATGRGAHAEGLVTEANYETKGALADASHSEGNNTLASGVSSHAEGHYTTASSHSSHSEGYETDAYGGIGAHAEGYGSQANGQGAHAEGHQSTASGTGAHAEGSSQATGDGAHAEGNNTIAEKRGSHSEGVSTQALEVGAHAEGLQTRAIQQYQHVQGKYNIEDTENKYAHIVGNGKNGARSNAHTLEWNGDAWYAGGMILENGELNIKNGKITVNGKGLVGEWQTGSVNGEIFNNYCFHDKIMI